MCKALEISSNILKYLSETETILKTLKLELKKCDLMRQDILHIIETSNFSAFEGYRLCKVLKDISTQRRKIKNELSILDSFCTQTLNVKETLNNIHQKILILENKKQNLKYSPKIFSDGVVL